MIFKRLKSTLLFFFLFSCVAPAADQNLVNLGRWSHAELMQVITEAHPIEAPGDRIVFLSRHFIATPYIADSLIGDPQTAERLVINLAGFDCFTFLDTIEALRRTTEFTDFPDQIKHVRYRDGKVTYEKRRHFFSDWVADDSRRIGDVTAEVGEGRAQVIVKQLNLKSDGTAWLPGLPVTRREITYIPTHNIDRGVLSALQEGDYVGIYSEQTGLDVSHTGLLVKSREGFILRHASALSNVRRVVDVDLLEYLEGKPGLLVYRAR